MKKLSILGSTGSIGTQTLEIVDENPDDFCVVALTANKSVEKVFEQVKKYRPKLVCMFADSAAKALSDLIISFNNRTENSTSAQISASDFGKQDFESTSLQQGTKNGSEKIDCEIMTGMSGMIAAATISDADIVVTAIVGMIGIRPTIEAIKAGKDVALANKETLVTAGHIIMPLVKEKGVKLLPVDSEHSAIFQSLQGLPYNNTDESPFNSNVSYQNPQIEKILLTASGGPFRGMKKEELAGKTRLDALKHPNWSMGAKITIDSATLVNKGLEMMEAGWLFGVDCDHIQVVVHPQSILHSAVQFVDGAIIGQMGVPDMKLPILYALSWPYRKPFPGKRVDLFELGRLTFEKADEETFEGLALAKSAMKTGGSMPTVFNAANEFLVAKFLKDEIGFLDIPKYIRAAMKQHKVIESPNVEEILGVQAETEFFLTGII